MARAMIPSVKPALQTRNVFLAVVFLGIFGMAVRNLLDPDVWWHLKTGEYIAMHHLVPHTDLFSYTRAGQPWVAHEWLTELFMYGLYRASGWLGLSVLFAFIVSASFYILHLRCPQNVFISGAASVWGAWATTAVWGVRPQIVSLLFTSVWLLILERAETDRRFLWWTGPLMILWVNLHAGFALGIGLLALFLAGEFLERISSGPSERKNGRLRALGLTLLLNLAVVPINPNGLRMYTYPIETLRSKAMQSYISEWASPDFHHVEYLAFLLLLLAVVVRLAWSRARLRLRDLLLLLVSAFAALSSIRLIPFFVLVAVPLIARPLEFWRQDRSRPSPTRHLAFNGVILAAMAGFVAVHVVIVSRGQPQAEAEHFPVRAAAYLASHPPHTAIFNQYDWGGYLIWKLYPGTRVFIDGRADVYGDDLFKDFMRTYLLTKEWQQTIKQWQVGVVVVPADSALATGLRDLPEWTLAFKDSHSVIFSLQPESRSSALQHVEGGFMDARSPRQTPQTQVTSAMQEITPMPRGSGYY